MFFIIHLNVFISLKICILLLKSVSSKNTTTTNRSLETIESEMQSSLTLCSPGAAVHTTQNDPCNPGSQQRNSKMHARASGEIP